MSMTLKDFHMKLEGAFNRHATMRKLNPKEIKIKNKPWMTPHAPLTHLTSVLIGRVFLSLKKKKYQSEASGLKFGKALRQ